MINPVFRRETRTTLRSWRIFAAMVIYTGVLALAAGVTLHINTTVTYDYSFNPQSMIMLFIVLLSFQNLIVAIIVPSLTAGAISGERERQTLDLMLLTKMSPLSIVVGKLMSSMLTILLIIIASLPVFSVVFYYGGVSLLNLFGMTAFTLLFAAMTGSISIFFSTITKKTIVSTVWTYIVLMAITLGNLIVTMVSTLFLSEVFNSYSGSIFLRLSFAFNPALAFIDLVDTQYNIGFVSELLNGASYNWFSSSSSRVLESIAKLLEAIPLWTLNVIVMAAITALALFLSARMIQPVRKRKM